MTNEPARPHTPMASPSVATRGRPPRDHDHARGARCAPAPQPESGLPPTCRLQPLRATASGCLQWTDDYSACVVGRRCIKLRVPRGRGSGLPLVPIAWCDPGSPRAPLSPSAALRGGPSRSHRNSRPHQGRPSPAPGDDQFSPWYGISDSLHPIAVHRFFQVLPASRRSYWLKVRGRLLGRLIPRC
jgi:hypothetical protein